MKVSLKVKEQCIQLHFDLQTKTTVELSVLKFCRLQLHVQLQDNKLKIQEINYFNNKLILSKKIKKHCCA